MLVRIRTVLLSLVSIILGPFICLAVADLLLALYSVLFPPARFTFGFSWYLYRGDSITRAWGSILSLPLPLFAGCVLIVSALLLFAVSRLRS